MRATLRSALLLAIASLALAVSLGAQIQSVDTSKSIVTQSPKPSKSKQGVFVGQVLSCNSQIIIVRDQSNFNLIRTFSYSPQVQDQIRNVIAHGGYQHGDKVTIQFTPGTEVALRIKGKPSSAKLL